LRVADVNDAQKAATTCLAERDARAITPWPILSRTLQYVLDFLFINVMIVNVRQAGLRINIEANVHDEGSIETFVTGCKSKAASLEL
jgi:hypothetical protein